MKNDVTNLEILDAINSFASDVDVRFDRVEADVSSLKSDVSTLKSDVGSLKNQMVTKNYLDDKMSDLRGDLVVLVRKEDKKLAMVVDELVKRDVFDKPTAKRIFELEPFAK